MKKGNFFALQFILSAILITMGALLEWKGKGTVHGVPYILFIVPGATILLSFFIDFLKLKSHLLYVLIYLVLYIVADIVVMVAFNLNVNGLLIGIAMGLLVLSVGVSTIFHFIYDNLKHPDRLIRF